jgi:hypothetical protein
MNSKIYVTVYFLQFVATSIFSQSNIIPFIENKGQWGEHVWYKADLPTGQALATPQGMLIGIFDSSSIMARVAWGNAMEERGHGGDYLHENPTPPPMKGHAWRLHFLNASPSLTIESHGQGNDFYNFWNGDAAHQASKVRSFNELVYTNVYSNIDVKYYTSTEGFLENDIIVKPFADAGSIAFEMEGIGALRLNAFGDLVMSTTVGDVIVPAPVSYLMDDRGVKTPIHVSYNLSDGVIRFNIPSYDHNNTLVIDPIVVRWATWATNASSGDTHNHGTAIDSSGNLYVVGRINATGLITTVGAFQTTAGGSTDIFIGKYTEPGSPGGAGSRVWQTYLGGSGADNAIGMQMGTDNYIYLSANTTSDMMVTYGSGFSGGWTQRSSGSGSRQQLLIVKLDLSGNGALTREIGSTANSYAAQASDIRLIKTGSLTYDLVYSGYVTQPANVGTADGDFPAPQTPSGTTYTQPSTAKLNAMILRISSNLSTLNWIRNIGSDVSIAKEDMIAISAIDAAGNIYAAGYTKGASNISYNNPSTQTALTGSQDGWIMKLDGSGVVQWSRYYNSIASGTTSILSMELNKADTNLIIAGTTSGLASSNITSGTVQTFMAGGMTDLFVAKISKTGSMTNWGTYFGGSGTETNMMGLNVDNNDDIYFLGYSSSTNYPTSSNPLQSTNFGSNDAVFTKLSSNGTTTMYSTYYGGAADDNDPVGQKGILFNNCRIYLSLTASSSAIPLTSGAVTTSKSSSSSVPEPVIVSMANPPDLINNTISSSQTISCNQAPSTFTAGAASYNLATISRDGVDQSNGSTGAYPAGVPSPSSYQWQKSTDYTYSWTSIAGATSQNYTSPALSQTTFFRRIVSGDYCGGSSTMVYAYVTGAPTLSPSATCAANMLSLFANPTGGNGGNAFTWSGPNAFSSTAENPQITSATSAVNGAYIVTVTDAGGCKNTKVMLVDFSSCTYSIVLSVSLLNFTAEKKDGQAILKWQTATERNSDHFIIERSTDGVKWTGVGSHSAAGNSNSVLNYKLIDRAPEAGTNYYRIKSVDFGGAYKYSDIKKVDFGSLRSATLIDAKPNPFTNTLSIRYHNNEEGMVRINILDALGRIVATTERNAPKGEDSMILDTSFYSSGVYFVSVVSGMAAASYNKIVKQ